MSWRVCQRRRFYIVQGDRGKKKKHALCTGVKKKPGCIFRPLKSIRPESLRAAKKYRAFELQKPAKHEFSILKLLQSALPSSFFLFFFSRNALSSGRQNDIYRDNANGEQKKKKKMSSFVSFIRTSEWASQYQASSRQYVYT